MQELMKFQGNDVELFNVHGKVYFNPYDVGRCLGLCDSSVRMAVSKMTQNQAVKFTKSTVKDIDNLVIPPSGRIFLTECGVYKLIFRSNKPKAEEFANWVTDEVLLSINHTGKYEIAPVRPPKQLTEYNYHAKYYNSIPVVSVSDIAHFTGVGRNALNYHLKHNKSFVLNRDYYLLTGPELAKFKTGNAGVLPETNKMYVVTQSGYKKLAKIFGKSSYAVEFKQLESPKLELNESNFNLLNNKTAYDIIMNIANHAEMIFTLLRLIKDYKCKQETCSSLAETLRIVAFRCGLKCSDLTDILR